MTIFSDEGGAPRERASAHLGWLRLGIGLAQGALLYGLYLSAKHETWPASAPALFAPLALTVAWLPVVLLGAVGRMRLRTLIAWMLGATLILTLMGWWSVTWEARPQGLNESLASPAVFALSAAMLFIAHHLILPADQARAWIAPYRDYFDTAWKAGVQLALSLGFTWALWGLLGLGALLFNVIGLSFMGDLIAKVWSGILLTTTTFALAVHLTDVRHGLIRGVRTVALVLLSWLLPFLVLITAGFIAALPFAGVGQLWEATSGSGLMLSAAAALIILINTAYQDGQPDSAPNPVLQWASRIASLLLPVLIGLALWGIGLRIGQYGLTPPRVFALACVLVGAVYAAGYAIAAVRPGPWMRPIERTNVIAGVIAVITIIALFTPLADPSRLSVADQMRRLDNGRISAEDFDYRFMRFDAGRSGGKALERLAASDDPEIARRAQEAMARENRYGWANDENPVTESDLVVLPEGAVLPPGFQVSRFRLGDTWHCNPTEPCVATVRDLDGDGIEEVLLATESSITIYARRDEAWVLIGHYWTNRCPGPRTDPGEILREGLELSPSPVPDLMIGGRRVAFSPIESCTP